MVSLGGPKNGGLGNAHGSARKIMVLYHDYALGSIKRSDICNSRVTQ
jgi:hypothetical protein